MLERAKRHCSFGPDDVRNAVQSISRAIRLGARQFEMAAKVFGLLFRQPLFALGDAWLNYSQYDAGTIGPAVF